MPLNPGFQSEELSDSLLAFPQGMHAGMAPVLLPKTQLSFLTNGTVRGDFPFHRPAYRKMNLVFDSLTTQTNFQTTKFQGAGMLNPISAADCLLASVSGNIFQITPGTDGSATVRNANPPNDSNPASPNQVWIFQTERWAIINDGQSIPMICDGVTTRRASPGGYPLTVQNVNDTNAGTYPSGTVVLFPTAVSYRTLFVGGIFGGGEAGPYTFASGLAAGSAVTFYTNQSYAIAVGQVFVIGSDLWTVTSFATWKPNPFQPGTDIFFTATCNNAIAPGTNYPANTQVFDTVQAQTVGSFVIPGIGNSQSIHISQSFPNTVPGPIFINSKGYEVLSIGGVSYPAAASPEMPPGRMGCNAGGRTWIGLPDGKSYIASDLTGDQSSGTANFNYTDAVLHFSENTLLAGGGAFRIPSPNGNIAAMIPTATLDASLGQGPIEILSPTQIWSCNAPTDRTTWQNLTYPIQSVSLLGAGGLSQWSTVNANSDTLMRSLDGIRSLVLARRDFDVWGNVPYSEEVEPIIAADNVALLNFSSAIVFDNRAIITANPQQSAQGVYHNRLIALNFDPVSSLTGKAPSLYDGIWTGLNVLQLVTGSFSQVQRAFAFVLNTSASPNVIELWEIQLTPPDPDFLPVSELSLWSAPSNHFDNGTEAIPMTMVFPILDFGQKDPKNRQYLQLNNGEIYIDHMTGTALFQMYYKPDDYPFWTLWYQWTETANPNPGGFPQFRPRMGLGTPSGTVYDNTNNRPLREGYLFQMKLIITGNVRFRGGRFQAVTIPEPKYAPPVEGPLATPGP